MSENDHLSDDDGGDLFESDSEDLYSEVGNSLDLPAFSLESLQLKAPPESVDDHEGHDQVASESGCATDQSDLGGFEMAVGPTGVTSALSEEDEEGEELEYYEREHEVFNDDEESTAIASEQEVGQIECHEEDNDNTGGEQNTANELTTTYSRQSDSFLVTDCDHEIDHLRAQQDEHDDEEDIVQMAQLDSHVQNPVFERCELKQSQDVPTYFSDPTESKNNTDPCFTEPTTGERLTPSNASTNEADLPPTVESPHKHGIFLGINEQIDNLCASVRDSPSENPEQESIIPGPVTCEKIYIYTVESLFPVVYEERIASCSLPEKGGEVPVVRSTTISSTSMNLGQRKPSTHSRPTKNVGSRLGALQRQLDEARSEITNATRAFKLQLSMVETDNLNFSQRNGRLKNQLAVATADLQRSNAELAKLKTENELYAAKLPRLQADLLEETSQVDQTQAQSMQAQLDLTQLKARSHVLQTRNQALEVKNEKLIQQLRECQQQLKRKVAALQQQTEKATKLEGGISELKATHMQDHLAWKSRMTSALQRFEREKNKLEVEWKSKGRKELREAKERAEKASKKWRVADATSAKLDEQLKHYKREASSAADTIQRLGTETRTLESLLRKAHRTEATARNELAACKTKLRALQDEKRRGTACRTTDTQSRRRQLEHKIPIELLLPLTDSSDDDDNQESPCCSQCKINRSIEPQPAFDTVCQECPALQNQLRQLRDELRRVRALHSTELHAQGSILDSLLANSNCNCNKYVSRM